MIVTYMRSSSIGTMAWCENKYFLQYNLGLKDSSGKKAWMGTVVHRVLQLLGDKKVAMDEGKRKVKNDDIPDLWLKECDDIPHVTQLCFDHYDKHDPVGAGDKELKQCIAWVNKAITYNNGCCDPRNQNVFATEVFFDIEIKKPWAKYQYQVGDTSFDGYLSLKGTVDLVLKEGEAYFQVLDYKTGKRLNWATGQTKEYEDFQKDPQLLLYYYALRNLYPDYEFFMSIYYINHGGEKYPDGGGIFSLVFDDSDYEQAENMIRQKFEYIRSVNVPSMLSPANSHWKCTRLCKFVEPSEENPELSVCQLMNEKVRELGVEKTVELYGDVSKINAYGAGGGVVDREGK